MDTAAAKNAVLAAQHSSGVVFDSLFVRHWDTYATPGAFEQLFVVPVSLSGGKVELGGQPRNVMAGTGLETPVKPFGGENDFDIAPDGSRVAFSARPNDGKQAWSTNTDIYLVNLPSNLADLSVALPPPVSITSANLGYDTNPSFSPNSKLLGEWIMVSM
ncbi:hypothetical protein HDU93_007765 [Gonapodya sp. JEL0774]|nr:hypothetical protein HDU93_007765 [Gonapodya sp. JEL0774]